ncbi:PepSY-associated TM helix domain-containing protein [Thalassobaculum salexigens]|uniref:PepSY-associated TM helix domain-containing protein n=1 Tax=Thalassobaculum salexigens TaxID=455360 RepID=UPI00248D4137|nr:PepSY-associated TM helix domain-containing protein [Thalassobaculum salexigens]
MRYRNLRRLHLWVSLLTAVPLLVLSLSGALLVYAPELQQALDGEVRNTGPVGASLSPTAIVDRVAQQRPELDIWSISLAKQDVWTAWLSGGAGVLRIDPTSGDILEHFHPKDRFEGWLTALHRRYLVDGPTAKWVRHGVSAVALLLVVQCAIGLWLWLKPPMPFRRLSVSFRQGTRFGILRLHQATGIATFLILTAVALTGMAMYWHDPMRVALEWATFSKVEEPQPPKDQTLAPLKDLDAGIAAATVAVPDARLSHFRLPRNPTDSMVVGLMPEGAGDGQATRVWVGDDPARVLYVYAASEANLATTIWHMRYIIHVGKFGLGTSWGPIVRALWVIVALVPAAFVISGLWLYLGRRSREQRSRARNRSFAPAE